MTELPAPLVPSDLDLGGFQFMPLDTLRLRDSDLSAIATGEGFRASVLGWCAAWHQVPAGSLPDDDRLLARLLGFGRDVSGFLAVRDDALRGYVKCSDGRLYHPVVCEKAMEASARKRKQRERAMAGNAARWGSQNQSGTESGGDADNEKAVCGDEIPEGSPYDKNGVLKGSPKDGDVIAEAVPEAIPEGSPYDDKTIALDRTGQDRTGIRKKDAPAAFASAPVGASVLEFPTKPPDPGDAPEKHLFDLGRQMFGKSSGGFTKNLLTYCEGDCDRAMSILNYVKTKSNPREYVGAIIRGEGSESLSEYKANLKKEYAAMGLFDD